MKNLYLMIIMILVILSLSAKSISENDIKKVAINWLEIQSGKTVKIIETKIDVNTKGDTLLYYIDFEPSGFVIISANDNVVPIIAYSTSENIVHNINPDLANYLIGLEEQIEYAYLKDLKITSNTKNWSSIMNRTIVGAKSEQEITMDNDWSETGIYDNYCPETEYGRSAVGTRGIALAQIVNFHKKFNYTFTSENDSYTSSRFINFDQFNPVHVTVHLDNDSNSKDFPSFNTLNTLTTSVTNTLLSANPVLNNTQKASLSFACALLLHSNFYTYSQIYWPIPSLSFTSSLSKLNYTSSFLDISSNTPETQYQQIIESNINQDLPVIYEAASNSWEINNYYIVRNTKCFVIKGYQINGDSHLYKMNWGNGGTYSNTWFSLNALGTQNNYFNNGGGLTYNIKPMKKLNINLALSNSSTFTGQAHLKIIDVQTNEAFADLTTTTGQIALSLPYNRNYDIVISHDSGNYEWYQAFNQSFPDFRNYINASLTFNPDKIIIVPDDYTDASLALRKIQDGGIVKLRNTATGLYGSEGWRYKHITLAGIENNVVVSNFSLIDPNINNTDLINNIKFTNNYAGGPIGILKLKNGASPRINLCSFINNTGTLNNVTSLGIDKNYMGLALQIYGKSDQLSVPLIENCTFSNNFISGGFGGAAVGLYGGATFNNCTFSNNRAENPVGSGDYGFVVGGTVIIDDIISNKNISFNTCTFTNNKSQYHARDIMLINSQNNPEILIENCTFNTTDTSTLYSKPSVELYYLENENVSLPFMPSYTDITIKNNIFKNLKYQALAYTERYGLTSLSLKNNIFYNLQASGQTTNAVSINSYGDHGAFPGNALKYASVINNTFKSVNGYGFYDSGSHLNKFYNNAFDQCTNGFNISSSGCGQAYNYVNTSTTTPTINNTFFQPIWSATYKSPCIDEGHPNLDGDTYSWASDVNDQDGDGTRMDIGAVPAETHGTLIHNFVNNGSTNQYNWVCFPYLDKLYTTTTSFDADQLYYNLQTYHGNGLLGFLPTRYLNNMLWNYNSNQGSVYHNGSSWVNSTMTLDSRYGFKVNLMSGVISKSIENTGFVCGQYGNTNETITIDAPIAGSAYREIWVGYFKNQSESPLVALSQIADKLILIQTKNWSMSRSDVNKAWFSGSSNPKINFGEMVVLRYKGTTSSSFTWQVSGGGSTETLAYTEPSTQYFSYNEQADYIPVYVKLDSNTAKNRKSNAELALFINDICYGAEVVQGDTVQINAYISALPDSNDVVEFRYWEPGIKSRPIQFNKYSVYDFEAEAFQNRPIHFSENKAFYAISLNAKDLANGEIPAITTLEGNYPNPFNPETTIRYSISEKSNVTLKIFNVKGQMVKELINETQNPGFRSIVWNGKDNKGKQVSSGVYFYRLDTNNSSSIRKMLLMK